MRRPRTCKNIGLAGVIIKEKKESGIILLKECIIDLAYSLGNILTDIKLSVTKKKIDY